MHFLGVKAKFLQPASLDVARLPVRECAEWWATPQRQGLAAHEHGALVLAEDQQLVTTPDQTLEASGVDVIGGKVEPVTLRGCLDRLGPDRLAQPNHTTLHHLCPRVRYAVGPQRISQPLGAQDVA